MSLRKYGEVPAQNGKAWKSKSLDRYSYPQGEIPRGCGMVRLATIPALTSNDLPLTRSYNRVARTVTTPAALALSRV